MKNTPSAHKIQKSSSSAKPLITKKNRVTPRFMQALQLEVNQMLNLPFNAERDLQNLCANFEHLMATRPSLEIPVDKLIENFAQLTFNEVKNASTQEIPNQEYNKGMFSTSPRIVK